MRFLVWILLFQMAMAPAFASKYRTLEGVKESSVRRLNPNFNVRSERSTSSAALGQVQTLVQNGKFNIDTRETNEDWIRVHTSAGSGWVHRSALQEIEVKTDFSIRAEPNSSSENRGTIAEGLFVRENDAIFTGRTEETTRNGKKETWHEIFVRGERSWVHDNAIVNKDMSTATPGSERAPAEVRAEEKPEEKKPKPEAKPEVQCVGSLNEARGQDRFKAMLSRGNPFTTWNGPWGATIVVQANGQAILNHPMKGRIPLTLSLCLDKRDRAFITVNGTKIFFKDENMSRISVTDPTSGDAYEFTRGVQ